MGSLNLTVCSNTHISDLNFTKEKKRIKVLKNSNKENIISRKSLAIYTD